MPRLSILVISFIVCFNSSCSLFGVRNLEEPQYEVLKKEKNIELRKYKPHIVAKTRIEGSYDDSQKKAFRRLAGYIFGGNQSKGEIPMTAPVKAKKGVSIAMTAPVNQSLQNQSYEMSFMMPSQYTLESLPTPKDPRIWFEQVPEKIAATISFSWFGSEERYRSFESELIKWLEKDGRFELAGSTNYAGYNPPWTIPFLRTNEVIIELKKKETL